MGLITYAKWSSLNGVGEYLSLILFFMLGVECGEVRT